MTTGNPFTPDLAALVRDVLDTPQLGPSDALSDWVKAELQKAWAARDAKALRVLLCNVTQYLYFGDMRERIGACELCDGGRDENLAAEMLLAALDRYEQIFAARAKGLL